MAVVRQTIRCRRHVWAAHASEWMGPLLARWACRRAAGRALPAIRWRRAVLLGADHLGDLLWISASLPHLKTAFPACEWHALASRAGLDALVHNPFLRSTHLIAEKGFRRFQDITRTLVALKPDAALCYNTGGYWFELMAAAYAGVPCRVGYVHKGFSGLVTQPLSIRFPQPYPAYFRDAVAQLSALEASWPLRPLLYPSREDAAEGEKVWRALGVGPNDIVAACFPFSRQAQGAIPPEWFAAVMAAASRAPITWLLCGTAGEERPWRILQARYGLARAHVLAGRLNARSMVSLLRHCDLAFCADSGGRHLANAANITVAFVRNLGARAIETGVYLPTEVDLTPPLAECLSPSAVRRVIAEMPPEQTAKRLLDILRRTGKSSKSLPEN